MEINHENQPSSSRITTSLSDPNTTVILLVNERSVSSESSVTTSPSIETSRKCVSSSCLETQIPRESWLGGPHVQPQAVKEHFKQDTEREVSDEDREPEHEEGNISDPLTSTTTEIRLSSPGLDSKGFIERDFAFGAHPLANPPRDRAERDESSAESDSGVSQKKARFLTEAMSYLF
ncbi:hypothetical protein MMC12_003525 [Toensbergia leucococca]|nr:hypothetical protein [Toensbergia leucococca]